MSRPRKVNGLVKAELMPSGPFPTYPRVKGSAARGLSFQRRVRNYLRSAFVGRANVLDSPWIKYSDVSGSHWCQPDFIIDAPDRVIVVEAKLTLRRLGQALVQLQSLYRPCVELVFDRPAVLCVAFHHWIHDVDTSAIPMVDEPEELLYPWHLRAPALYGWHFL